MSRSFSIRRVLPVVLVLFVITAAVAWYGGVFRTVQPRRPANSKSRRGGRLAIHVRVALLVFARANGYQPRERRSQAESASKPQAQSSASSDNWTSQLPATT